MCESNARGLHRCDEGPVDEHEADAVRAAVVVEHLPRQRLLVRHRPAEARHAQPAGDAREPLLHDAGELRAQVLPPLLVEHLLQGDVLERHQRRLQHVQPGLVREREHRHGLRGR
jgi:hypothetical protein